MGDLVDGLLTLARLGQVPEPVRKPVDLAQVAAVAAVATVHGGRASAENAADGGAIFRVELAPTT